MAEKHFSMIYFGGKSTNVALGGTVKQTNYLASRQNFRNIDAVNVIFSIIAVGICLGGVVRSNCIVLATFNFPFNFVIAGRSSTRAKLKALVSVENTIQLDVK